MLSLEDAASKLPEIFAAVFKTEIIDFKTYACPKCRRSLFSPPTLETLLLLLLCVFFFQFASNVARIMVPASDYSLSANKLSIKTNEVCCQTYLIFVFFPPTLCSYPIIRIFTASNGFVIFFSYFFSNKT